MFGIPEISPADIIGILVVTVISIIIFMIRGSSTRNLYFGDWWARAFKMRNWKKNTAGVDDRGSWEREGMPAPERELCNYYLKFAQATDRRTFTNAVEWLKLAGQGDIRPMPLWGWVILFILTIGEATGTGLLLAGAASNKVTANELLPLGFMLAAVLAFGLLGATHSAGEEAAFSQAIKNYLGNSASTERLGAEKIEPKDDYRIDDGVEDRFRFANRALSGDHKRAGKGARVFAACFLGALVILIFGVRVFDNYTDYTNSLKELPTTSSCGAPSASNSSDPFANMSGSDGSSIPGFAPGTASPPSVNCNSTSANNSVDKSGLQSTEVSKDISAAILALLYVLVQFMGYKLALKHSFFADGKKAYGITRGYPSYDELYRDKLEPVYKLGNIALQRLRTHLISRVNRYRDNPSHMTIQDYAIHSRYKRDASKSETELEDYIGKETFKKARDYRKKLVKIDPDIDPYPMSLNKYRYMVELEEHQNEVSYNEAKNSTPIQAAPLAPVQQKPYVQQLPQTPVEPVITTTKPVVPSHTSAADLPMYDILDIEAAEEMLGAGSVLERKQILEALSEGDETKKALLQEIYKKLKEAQNG